MGDEIPGAEAGESASSRRPVREPPECRSSETERAEAIGACIEALAEELEALASEDRALARFLCELRNVDPGRDRRDGWEQAERPAPGSLDRALSDIPPEWKLGNAVLSVAPLLDWRQVFKSDDIDPHLQKNLTMASLAVRRGGPRLSVPASSGCFSWRRTRAIPSIRTPPPRSTTAFPEGSACSTGSMGSPFPSSRASTR